MISKSKVIIPLLALCLGMYGCKTSQDKSSNSKVKEEEVWEVASPGRPEEEDGRPEEGDTRPEKEDTRPDLSLGIKVISGRLQSTKGNMAVVDNVFLPAEYICGPDGRQWKPEFLGMKDKLVEVKGMIIRHHCTPVEQCPEAGYLDLMKRVEYLHAAE